MAWPNGASAAISLTFDNMGEAADLNRKLWPRSQPIGNHYSVTTILPQFLALVRKHNIPITYFVEAWNLGVYPDAVKQIAEEGHEVGWHAWQHEAWGKECAREEDERRNFEWSFGAMGKFCTAARKEGGEEGSKVEMYHGFRPPGGTIHHENERTLKMCREYGLGYISPAAQEGALVPLHEDEDGEEMDSIVVLPFRWSTVDAYYYMDAFSGLRKMKGELPEEAQGPDVLVESYIRQIDETIEKGGFLSLLFHPFLTDCEERMQALESVVRHLGKRREEGRVWLARCKDVEAWVREHPDVLGRDPGWDDSSWR